MSKILAILTLALMLQSNSANAQGTFTILDESGAWAVEYEELGGLLPSVVCRARTRTATGSYFVWVAEKYIEENARPDFYFGLADSQPIFEGDLDGTDTPRLVVRASVDHGNYFIGDGQVITIGDGQEITRDLVIIYFSSATSEFVEEMASGLLLKVEAEKKNFSFSLKGSRNAFETFLSCVERFIYND